MRRLMMMVLGMALLSVGLSGQARAELVAYWSFNYNALPGGGFGYLAEPSVFPYPADVGNASLSVGGGSILDTLVNGNGDTVYRWLASQAGSTLNLANDEISGGSLAMLIGTRVDKVNINNGSYVQFQVDLSNHKDLVISYATRRTSTGFNSHEWAWSTDGVNFTTFETVTEFLETPTPPAQPQFEVKTLSTLTALDNVSTAYLRVTLDGGFSSSDNGNTRFDNIQFNAEPSEGGSGATVVSASVYHNTYSGAGSKVDSDKVVYKETGSPTTLTYANLINTSAGIDGVLFGVNNLGNPGALSASDFEIKVSPTGAFNESSNPPSSWAGGPAPTVNAGTPGQVLLTWSTANAIKNQWLRITIKANANTGLASPEVYYVGHLLGETTGPGANGFYVVSVADVPAIRNQAGVPGVTSSNIADIDKNGQVNFSDIGAARPGTGSELPSITVPPPSR